MCKNLLAALVAVLLATGPAVARTAPLRFELNRLEPREGGACRVWLVLSNASTPALDPVRLDLVLFGRDGVVLRRLALDVGPLPSGRIQARIFDLAGQPCDGIGSMLLNDLLACGGTEAEVRSACIDRTALASRVEGVAFQK